MMMMIHSPTAPYACAIAAVRRQFCPDARLTAALSPGRCRVSSSGTAHRASPCDACICPDADGRVRRGHVARVGDAIDAFLALGGAAGTDVADELLASDVTCAVSLELPGELGMRAFSKLIKLMKMRFTDAEASTDTADPSMAKLSKRAGLVVPVAVAGASAGRSTGRSWSLGAAVSLAAVVELVVAEVVELGGDAARDNGSGSTVITTLDVERAIRNDSELRAFFAETIIFGAGLSHDGPVWGLDGDEEADGTLLSHHVRAYRDDHDSDDDSLDERSIADALRAFRATGTSSDDWDRCFDQVARPGRRRGILRDDISYFDVEVFCRLLAKTGIARVEDEVFDELRRITKDIFASLLRTAMHVFHYDRRTTLLAVDILTAVSRAGRNASIAGLGLARDVDLPHAPHRIDWAAAARSAPCGAAAGEEDDDAMDGDEAALWTDAAAYASRVAAARRTRAAAGSDAAATAAMDSDAARRARAAAGSEAAATVAMVFDAARRAPEPAICFAAVAAVMGFMLGVYGRWGYCIDPRAVQAAHAVWEARLLALLSDARVIAAMTGADTLRACHFRLARRGRPTWFEI
ncbi:hypothetical protein M885DRAFT_561468 [Pelagophyceae sp. CCMP2097]|nr:hypothetical protein M885DRAFT_561468 [Pelagophyceae sp. CCMP2097]